MLSKRERILSNIHNVPNLHKTILNYDVADIHPKGVPIFITAYADDGGVLFHRKYPPVDTQ